MLWVRLRAVREQGLRFRRQVVIGSFICDFVCHRSKVIVEVDGSQHGEDGGRDAFRDAWLADRGYHIIRVWNREVRADADAVADSVILKALNRLPPP